MAIPFQCYASVTELVNNDHTSINSVTPKFAHFSAKYKQKEMVIDYRQQVKFMTLNQRVVGSSPTWRNQ